MENLKTIWEKSGSEFAVGVSLLIDNGGSQLVTAGILNKFKQAAQSGVHDAYLRGKLAEALDKITPSEGVKFSMPPVDKLNMTTRPAPTPEKKKQTNAPKRSTKNTRTTTR